MKYNEGVTLRDVEEDEILIRVHAAGVNPSDTYVRLGPEGPYAGNKKLIPSLPYTPGKDGAGVVEKVGPNVTEFCVGDRVYVSGSKTGTYARHAICGESQVFSLPESVSFEQGACVGVPCATAYRAVHTRGGATKGDAVFIHGASGAVGLAAVQLAVDAGCVVVGSAGTTEGEDAVRAAGAHGVVNHRTDGYLDAAVNLLQGFDAEGFDLLLEMAADINLVADLGIMRGGGRVAIVGSKARTIALNPRLAMPNELDIRGVFLGNAKPSELRETHAALFKAMETGVLSPVVDSAIPLESASQSHEDVMNPPKGGSAGNVVLMC